MAHPMNEHRAHHHEKERVNHIAGKSAGGAKCYARGGKVHEDEAEDRQLIKKEVKGSALKHEGKKPKMRADKAMRRAKGGKVHGKGHSKTNVNVIVAPGGNKPPMAGLGGGMPPQMASPPMPPKPPMAAPSQPPAPAPAMGAPNPLGGMPPRRTGGRAYKRGGKIKRADGGETKYPASESAKKLADAYQIQPWYGPEAQSARSQAGKEFVESTKKARGGKVSKDFGDADMNPAKYGKGKEGDMWGPGKPRAKGGKVEGKKSAADVVGKTGIGTRTPIQHSGNKSDTQNVGRGKPITYATGGPVEANGKAGKQMAPHIGAGNNGIGRLKKAHMGSATGMKP